MNIMFDGSNLSEVNVSLMAPMMMDSYNGDQTDGQQGNYNPFNSTAAPGKYLCADQDGIKVSDQDCGNSTALKLGSSGSIGTLCLNTAVGWTNTGCAEFNWGSNSSCQGGNPNAYGTVATSVTSVCSFRIGDNGMDMNIGFDGSVFTFQEIQAN